MIEIKETNNYLDIREQWEKLCENNEDISYYQSIEAMDLLWENLKPYRFIHRINPRFFLFYKNNEIIMILPVFKRWLSKECVGYGYKAGFGYIGAVYIDNIGNDLLLECFSLLRSIKNIRITINRVKAETSLGMCLKEYGGEVSEEGYTVIDMPDNYNDYYNSLSKHMKQNLRTAYNRLKTDKCEYTFECIPYSQMKSEQSKELEKLYIDRQIYKYKKSKLYSFFVRNIDLETKMQKSKNVDIRAFVLRINGMVSAYFDGIYNNGEVIVPRLAIADGFNRYSPGVILLNESIKHLIENKIDSIDLTHGQENYKISMGGKVHQCIECKI